MSALSTLIEYLPSTSSLTIKRLKKTGINSFFDLLNFFPYKYKDYSLKKPLSKVEFGEVVTVQGKIIEKREDISKKGLKIQLVKINDKTGYLWLLWFNQRYVFYNLKIGDFISASGDIKPYFMQKTLFVEEYEKIDNFQSQNTIHTARIVPYYPEKNKLSSRVIREKIFSLLKLDLQIEDFLPQEIKDYNQLIDLKTAYYNIHFPQNYDLQKKAKYRLAFDELFLLQLAMHNVKKNWEKNKKAPKFKFKGEIQVKFENLIKSLPFKLTNAQEKAIKEIINDLLSGKPMNRFLHGDVGSGKTVVAALAAFLAILNDYQVAFMAPTEILAIQHYKTFNEIFNTCKIKIALQTGSKKVLKEGIIRDYQIIIGTHALISEKIKFEKLGLVIIDEQQRFGVLQRAMLKQKAKTPHFLTMTATPIPRTAALVFYGELSISTLDEMPKGKKIIKSYLIPPYKRQSAYKWIKEKVKKEECQVYIVCPLIEESEKETLKNVKAATAEYEKLKKIFSSFNLGLLHGKMKPKEKERVIEKFKKRQIDILVSTPVIEVGIDVPTANIIVIEAAERYGLSQLHQLRGRVGRGKQQGYCLVFTETKNKDTLKRLQTFVKINDGFKLSEYDLKIRGPGEIFGTRQHGFINVKIASLLDYQLIKKTNKAADYFITYKNFSDYPKLKEKIKEIQQKITSID